MSFQNPYMNPFMMQPQMMQTVQPAQVVKVNGENGARTYQLGANSSALLLDESGLMVWLITTDGAGYKTVSAYDITPHTVAPSPDFGSLENRIKRLEEKINGYSEDTATAARRIPDSRSGKADDSYVQKRRPAGGAESAYDDESEYETGDGNRRTVRRRLDEGLQGDL